MPSSRHTSDIPQATQQPSAQLSKETREQLETGKSVESQGSKSVRKRRKRKKLRWKEMSFESSTEREVRV